MIKTKNIKSFKFSKIEEFLKLEFINNGTILAGGSLRTLFDSSDKVQDYDIFFLGEDVKEKKDLLSEKIKELGGKQVFQCEKDELRSFELNEMKIQFISIQGKIYNSVQELIDSFDINASRFAWDGEHLYFYSEAAKDVVKRHITINLVTYPVATLKRIAKYKEKGFQITLAAIEFVKQVAQNSLDMDLDIVYID